MSKGDRIKVKRAMKALASMNQTMVDVLDQQLSEAIDGMKVPYVRLGSEERLEEDVIIEEYKDD